MAADREVGREDSEVEARSHPEAAQIDGGECHTRGRPVDRHAAGGVLEVKAVLADGEICRPDQQRDPEGERRGPSGLRDDTPQQAIQALRMLSVVGVRGLSGRGA